MVNITDALEMEYKEKKLQAEARKKNATTLAIVIFIVGAIMIAALFGKPILLGTVNKTKLFINIGIVATTMVLVYIIVYSLAIYNIRKYDDKLANLEVQKHIEQDLFELNNRQGKVKTVTPRKDRHDVINWSLTEYTRKER